MTAAAAVEKVRSADRRRPCTVGLDLRTPGQAGAVAVDAAGRLLAWGVVSGDGGPAALAKLAIDALSVRPKQLRVLLGSAAQTGIFLGDGPPATEQIAESLLADGYDPIAGPAVASVSPAPGRWLVARCSEEMLRSLAEQLSEAVVAEPIFVVDQLLLARRLERDAAVVESTGAGLSVVAVPRDAAPVARSLPALVDAADAAGETERTLRAAGVKGGLRVLGAERDALLEHLDRSGLKVWAEPLPTRGAERLPASLELAWRLAAEDEPPALTGPRLERRRESLLWAQRTAWAAIALGLLGLVLVVSGLVTAGVVAARQRALRRELAAVGSQIQQLQETAVFAEEVQKLRAELAGQALPWPPLAETVIGLANNRPADVGWERLVITDAALELEVSASGPTPFRELELMRGALESSPGITNLAWDEPVLPERGKGVRQTFRARLRDPQSAPPGQPPGEEAAP